MTDQLYMHRGTKAVATKAQWCKSYSKAEIADWEARHRAHASKGDGEVLFCDAQLFGVYARAWKVKGGYLYQGAHTRRQFFAPNAEVKRGAIRPRIV